MTSFLKLLCLLVAAYCVVAGVVFEFRHPWMTETEAFLNFHKALQFQTVRYQDLRPRDP